MTRRLLVLIGLALLTTTACGTRSSIPTTRTTPAVRALPTSAVHFAQLVSVPLGPGVTSYAGPPTPHSLVGVKVTRTVRRDLAKPGVSEALTANGFVVVPSDFRLFHMAYEGNVYEGWPVFVTTDVAFHEWHLVFDKVLRSLEEKVLLPKLERLVAGLLQGAHAQAQALAGSSSADAAARIEQLYEVAAAELGSPVALGPLAAKEKALVDAHRAAGVVSPVLGVKTDYSLYTPRGHYTRSADLRRYFTAMSVLGQAAFCLPGTVDCDTVEPARLGILASRVLVSDPQLVALWRDVYEPTAFLVGAADDYTPLEVADAAAKATRNGIGDTRSFADDQAVRDVVAALAAARPVLISPDRAAIRVMGTRFTVDSFVLDRLIWPYVGTSERKRLVPSPLDLAASFGSTFAYGVQQQAGETAYTHYNDQLATLRKEIAARPVEGWGSTVYDSWLWALEPMFGARGVAYPDFMRSQAWTAKAHQSAFGSYTELKHDTILYTKQAVAEGGDNPQLPARRNWVEPEPAVFARLAAATDLMRSGLADRKLLTPESAQLLRTERGLFLFLERIARDELAGRPIIAKDNERLTYMGGELEARFMLTADLTATGAIADRDAAVVADIASSSKGILEIGTGRIDRIYVLVPDDAGTFQVAAGGVYSYYEFTSPPGQRLTDEEWRTMLASGQAPARPAWEGVFLAR